MRDGRPSYASLFSGCGGFDIGFSARGFSPCGAYDCDADAIANFRANITAPVYQVDLTRGIPNEQLLHGVDVLIAGPPCQGFSTVGKRLIEDKRNHLVTLTGDLARRVQPSVLVVENVAGVLAGTHSRYWKQLETSMRSAGYRTCTVWCQAADLGMAQLRKRALLFAWRTDHDISFGGPARANACLSDVLQNVERCHNHERRELAPSSRDWRIARRIQPGQKLSNVRGGDNAVATWDIPEVFGNTTECERTVLELLRRLRRQARRRSSGDADPVSFSRLQQALGRPFHNLVERLITKGYVRKIGDSCDLVGTFNGKYRRLAWSKPSCTVDTRFGSPRYFLHPVEERGFSVREAARIQGFPDTYRFQGTEAAQYRLIGNAVAPPVGAFVAEIAKRLLGVL